MQNGTQIPESRKCEPAKYEYKKTSYAELFEVLQSLRKHEVFCDVKLETDDKKIIFAHKVVLASASPYFHAMFTNFAEKNYDLVTMRQLNSTCLQPLVNFIYSGEIVITEKNVQDLLSAANLLQLQEVKDACCDFLETQLCSTNCIGINKIADFHSCTKLLTSSELYIRQHFSEVADGDEFLSLSSKEVIKLISSDELIVPSEEKVFESVILWVKHDILGTRKCILPQLMEYVRLPLASKHYILKKVIEEPLIKNCLECKDYVIEALHFHLLKLDDIIPKNNRNKPRKYGDQVILVVGGIDPDSCKSTEWYDPIMDRWHFGPELITSRSSAGLATVKDNLVFALGGTVSYFSSLRSVDMLDLSSESPCWKPTVQMLNKRRWFGVGVINDNLYAVGGSNNGGDSQDSAEVFDYKTQKWRMVSSMATRRSGLGVGVLNDLLYVVGGHNYSSMSGLDTVECYHPSFDTWKPVAKMCVCRTDAGVGVLDGVLYVVGGRGESNIHRSVETYRPSIGVWTSIGDMHLPRRNAGVVALNGLLYVVGGNNGTSSLNSVECYSPHTNTWTMVTMPMNDARTYPGVIAINRPQLFNTC
ncbi:kelch-like protein 3 [Acyrthosiphon pisum]|uniref:Kelch-like protein diablo n=1 Tax=Acyrthosiphon pisum TaxID=7029 RepID=A0A8R2F859_ACYPI|nr:kelch-like protein 3 [Acyrthosiphon pisum]|eukprot:XP_008183072.2 PREDICTED: kelch-like protein 3 [Acyrthosiphon pisum]